MPSHKNRLKLTGDTHLPDVGDDYAHDDDTAGSEPSARPLANIAARAQEAMDTINDHVPVRGYVERARQQVRGRPVVAVASAFALGLLFARI
jgi:hypothetical protein